MTQADLVMIPSAIKLTSPSNQKVYSILPINATGDFNSGWNNYSPIATRYNKDLLVEFGLETRLDWYSKGNCPTLLLEGTRTNTFINSNNFLNWIQNGGVLVQPQQNISPSGVVDAFKISGTYSSNVSQQVFRNTYTTTYENYSIFVKRGQNGGAYDPVILTVTSPSGANSNMLFNFDTKEITTSFEYNIYLLEKKVRELPNGWYRLEMRFIMDNYYASNFSIGAYPNTELFIWGAQREQTDFTDLKIMPSSYIPTTYTQVTRSQDYLYGSGDSSLFNSPEGSLFYDIQEIKDDYQTPLGNTQNISLANLYSFTSNIINIEFDLNGFTTIKYKTPSGTEEPLGFQINRRERNKFAISWNENTLKIAHNGEIKTNLTHTIGLPSGLDELSFDDGNREKRFFGELNDVRYYDKLLLNSELIELTRI